MKTWVVMAAEAREFSGILKRAGVSKKVHWPGAAFAREISWRGERWLLVANGPGSRLVSEALGTKREVDGIISIGFCGALDPSLRVGDIVQEGVLTLDRVVITAEEKGALREQTGAAVVEMESAAVEAKAREWGVAFRCVKVVSDAAGEDLPLDFNKYRDAQGRFSRARIAMAALMRPSAIGGLLRLDKNCRAAAESLGEFLETGTP